MTSLNPQDSVSTGGEGSPSAAPAAGVGTHGIKKGSLDPSNDLEGPSPSLKFRSRRLSPSAMIQQGYTCACVYVDTTSHGRSGGLQLRRGELHLADAQLHSSAVSAAELSFMGGFRKRKVSRISCGRYPGVRDVIFFFTKRSISYFESTSAGEGSVSGDDWEELV